MTKGRAERKYDLENRLVEFAVRIIDVVNALSKARTGSHIADQLIRCGTSPAANYGEAQAAESRNDFVHKMKVALKELRETRVWLLIIQRCALVKTPDKLDPLLGECDELIAIFVASIGTALKNKGKSP
ncbi:MAG: four helix bundle protein [Planctomycetes bacterium]|nr:four helix bundle protein [Planctomycetota bacterium]